mmetsp:Transcript_110885/g.192237  ORF Transcript_110885/g.192237 Transcript_110885/m.192237 type:complete len:80 (+) Transcript_110885:1129-1368(+)
MAPSTAWGREEQRARSRTSWQGTPCPSPLHGNNVRSQALRSVPPEDCGQILDKASASAIPKHAGHTEPFESHCTSENCS